LPLLFSKNRKKAWKTCFKEVEHNYLVFSVENSTVAIVKGERAHEPVFRALDLIDYKSCFAGYKQVLIKINFITIKT